MPARPARPLSTWQILKVAAFDSLGACDDALFDDLIVERRFFWRRAFIVSDPAGAQQVLRDNFDNYPRVEQLRALLQPGLKTGMLSAEGETWKRHRRLINPTLDPRAIAPDLPTFIDMSRIMGDQFAAMPEGHEIDIGRTLSPLIVYQMEYVFTGRTTASEDTRMMISRMAKFPGQRRVTDLLPRPAWLGRREKNSRIRAEAEANYPLVDELIAERRNPAFEGREDLVWRMLHSHDPKLDERLSDAEVRDETLTLALGAVETTLRPMSWVWYLLAMHPWAEERLHAELQEVLGGRLPVPDDLPRLVYLRQVLNETMRLYPPVPVMLREAAARDELCGHRVPRRSIMVVAPWVIHRHRKLWDDPDRFDPERFTPERVAARPRYAYLPFALGPRICVGAALATSQLLIAIAVLAQRFRFRVVESHPIEPVGWTTLRAHRGIRMTVHRR